MNNNKPLWVFVALFILPLVLAYVALQWQWLPSSSSNKGELMQSHVELDNWQQYEVMPWTLALVNQPSCQQCEQQWQALDSLYVALGKNQQKVRLAVLGEPLPELPSVPQQLSISDVPQVLEQDHLYLIDQHGLVVLQYALPNDEAQSRLVHKDVLSDVKKLLKYARSS